MNEEIEALLKRLFPGAARIESDADGHCPLCKEMGLDLEKDPRAAGIITILPADRKPH